ncbi:hypothetical protein LTR37_007873 [Vermiconidia calcicola]|uniref:Uncharacterized protein n=1 Tax=Vermiconidia calcicola TaxID=1690605 RepID=A0ACC3NCG9_9PEZI|nr:hypothetical protein LTR37_007873 [Vermiconidia calcicola]
MLERVTACLKSGAAREPLRCARKAPRSKRMLHSTFWNHGAGVLDLPQWALPMFPIPSDLPLKSDSMEIVSSRSKKASREEVPTESSAMADGVFLDFLYPPKALAWFRRTSGQQLQRWEKRNMRRLPEGYVLVSRRYTSRSYRPFEREEDVSGHRSEPQSGDASDSKSWYDRVMKTAQENENTANPTVAAVQSDGGAQRPLRTDALGSKIVKSGPSSEANLSLDAGFADSPGELAEAKSDRMQTLRNIIMSTRERTSPTDTAKSLALTERAWSLYESLNQEYKEDIRLKQELLDWLAVQQNESAVIHCTELYHSIPKESRTFEVYSAALALFMSREEHALALDLHTEALENLENGYLISRTLFRHAVDKQQWPLAIQAATQHNATYSERNQLSQIRVFWLHVSEMPQLFEKAVELAKIFGREDGLGSADSVTREFCSKFFKEAISHELSISDGTLQTNASGKQVPPRASIRTMFQHIFDMDSNASKFFEHTLMTVLDPESKINYSDYHHVISFVYLQYCKMPGVVPSQPLLLQLLRRVTRYWEAMRQSTSSRNSVDTSTVVDDWERFHDHLNHEAITFLVTHHARCGRVEEFEKWWENFRSVYPAYTDQRDVFWTLVLIHARRADLDKAQQAFAKIRRAMAEHGEEPDLKCWNILLHAHSRCDDLEGALTNFHNLVHYAKLKPDLYSFNSVIWMVAKHGDVAGTEDLLRQYDQLVGGKRHTSLMAALMTAHSNNHDIRAAEGVLREMIAMRDEARIHGPFTQAFNCLLGFYATRRDVKNTMRVYRLMKHQNVRLDGDSFAMLMKALVAIRHTHAAYKILREVMPDHDLQPTAHHYSLVLAGYTKMHLYKEALEVHERMTNQNIKPTLSANVHYLKAKAAIERRKLYEEGDVDQEAEPARLEETIKELEEIMLRQDATDIASGDPTPVTDKLDLDNPIAPYFDFLIFIHGHRRCFSAVQDLFAKYKEMVQERGRGEPMPIRMLSALMSAHWYAREHDKVEEYWNLAKDQADRVAPSVQVPRLGPLPAGEEAMDVDPLELEPIEYESDQVSSDPTAFQRAAAADVKPSHSDPVDQTRYTPAGTMPMDSQVTGLDSKQILLLDKQVLRSRPAPGKRHILNRPLLWYLKALSSQSRIKDAITTVAQLLSQGYIINKRPWNFFIRSLLDSSPPLALLAFILTERFLIKRFPGWKRTVRSGTKTQEKLEHLEHMRARYLKPNELMPEYETLVRLGAAMLDIRRFESMGRRGLKTDMPLELQRYVGTVRQIRTKAAKTMYAVQSMPRVNDKVQSKFLRRESS